MSSEEGLCGLCGLSGPLEEIQNHFMNVHTEAGKQNEEEEKTEQEQLRWASEHIILLIRLVEKHYSLFDSSLEKKVWMKIASELCNVCGQKFSHIQVENKWKGLKKTYKKIKDHNNKSGNDRRSWEYFNIMDTFMSKRPEVIPPATCSSSDGLKINQEEQKENASNNSTPSSVPDESPSTSSSFMRKRKLREQVADTRHKEKIERYDKFLALYQMSIEHQIGKKIEWPDEPSEK